MTYINNDTQFAIYELALQILFEEINPNSITWKEIPQELVKEAENKTIASITPEIMAQSLKIAQTMSEDNEINHEVCKELEEYDKKFWNQKLIDAEYARDIARGII